MSHKYKNIKCLTYARRSDQTVLAEHGQSEVLEHVRNVIKSEKFRHTTRPGHRTKFTTSDAKFHMLAFDDGLVVIAVTAINYPSRVVFHGLCNDMHDTFVHKNLTWRDCGDNALKGKFKGPLSTLTKEYEDSKSKSKMETLKDQVAVVKESMGHNIEKALANLNMTDDIATESDALLENAKLFNKKAKKLAWKEWCAMMKMWFILLGVLLLVGVVIFLVICGKTNCFAGGKSPSPASNRF